MSRNDLRPLFKKVHWPMEFTLSNWSKSTILLVTLFQSLVYGPILLFCLHVPLLVLWHTVFWAVLCSSSTEIFSSSTEIDSDTGMIECSHGHRIDWKILSQSVETVNKLQFPPFPVCLERGQHVLLIIPVLDLVKVLNLEYFFWPGQIRKYRSHPQR